MFQKPVDTGSTTKLSLPQDAWMIYKFENHEVIRLDLEPGESIDNHTNDWRIIFYLIQGDGVLNIQGRDHQVTTNQFIAVEPGVERYWTNTGENTLKLLVNKTWETT